jgi:hypothetical protein
MATTKKNKKETKINVKVRDLKPKKDAKGGGHGGSPSGSLGGLGSYGGLDSHGSH